MKKMFGEKPEPWLDTARFDRVADGRSSRNSWSDIPRSSDDLIASTEQATRSLSKSTAPPNTGSYRSLSASGSHSAVKAPSSPAIGRTTTGKRAIPETRTSTRMAWENQGERATAASQPQMRGLTKVLLIAAPVALAIGGIGAWQYMEKQHGAATAVAPAAMAAHNATDDHAAHARSGRSRRRRHRRRSSSPMPTAVAAAKVAKARRCARRESAGRAAATASAVPARAPARGKAAVATSDEPAPALEATTVPKAEPVQVPTPTPRPDADATAPHRLRLRLRLRLRRAVVAEPTMMVLSSATVSLVAGDHAAQLAKCEGSGSLHGDIAISFEINGAGRVDEEPGVVDDQEHQGRLVHPDRGSLVAVPEAAVGRGQGRLHDHISIER